MRQIRVFLLIIKNGPVLLARSYIYFSLLYNTHRYLQCSRLLISNYDGILKSAGVRSWKTCLIFSFHGTIELKARRIVVLTPSFMSNANILFSFSHSTHKSDFSVPHSLWGVRFPIMDSGDMVQTLHGSWFNHCSSFCPISNPDGRQFRLSPCLESAPFCLIWWRNHSSSNNPATQFVIGKRYLSSSKVYPMKTVKNKFVTGQSPSHLIMVTSLLFAAHNLSQVMHDPLDLLWFSIPNWIRYKHSSCALRAFHCMTLTQPFLLPTLHATTSAGWTGCHSLNPGMPSFLLHPSFCSWPLLPPYTFWNISRDQNPIYTRCTSNSYLHLFLYDCISVERH